MHTIKLDIKGMTCGGCANGVNKRLQSVTGVTDAHVDLALEQATVSHDGAVTMEALVSAFDGSKYSVIATDMNTHNSTQTPTGENSLDWRLWMSALLTLPLVVQMVLMAFGMGKFLSPLVEMIMIAPVQFVVGLVFVRGAVSSIRDRAANMDVLVALGTFSAYGLSVYAVITQTSHIYFEASGVIITLVLLGKRIEAKAKQGAGQALRHLMALRPKQATVMRGATPTVVPIAHVQVGDVVLVKSGEVIPADGTITQGSTDVDESLLTGESNPVFKTVSNPVVAGSINGDGAIEIQVTQQAADNTINRIVHMVQNAITGKSPVQQLVDKITMVFVPVIVVLALATVVIAYFGFGVALEKSILQAISVLVIACPCALGLATPTALVSGLGRAAKQGIVIQNLDVLEYAHRITHIVLDKTGTLTQGKMSIAMVQILHGNERQLWGDIIAIQQYSQHPLSHAFVNYGRDNDFSATDSPVTDMTTVAGKGVMGTVNGHCYAMGSREIVTELGITVPPVNKSHPFVVQGGTVLYVVRDTTVVAMVGIQDVLRPESPPTIAQLKADGITPVMMTGDSSSVAKKVALLTGIQDVFARVKPQDKMNHVQTLQQSGAVVAMVGDGVNDAPALAQADIGIAMGAGTDVAVETAGMVLMDSNIGLLYKALDSAKRTRKKIKQNLFWAFIYNTVAIPLAMSGLLTPAIAGLAMTLSSITVVVNSWLLSRA